MKVAIVLLMVPTLVGCDVASNGNGTEENVTISADGNGQVAFKLPFAKGDIKVPAAMMHNGQFDIDRVKMIPGGSMTGFHLDSKDGVSNVNMDFTAPQTPDAVRAYFVDQFRKQGVQAALSGDAVTGKSKDGTPFTIRVTPGASGSQGSIVIRDTD